MAYCVLDDLKELGYTWSDSDTANITEICETASNTIDAYCKQTFSAVSGYSETGDVRIRNGDFRYFPQNLTITAVNSASFRPIHGLTIPFSIDGLEYDVNHGVIIGYTNAPSGEYRVSVNYDYGYASGNFPDDLVKATTLACAPLLDDYFLSQESNVSMVKSIKEGELRIERLDTLVLPQNVTDILDGGNHGLGYVRYRVTS